MKQRSSEQSKRTAPVRLMFIHFFSQNLSYKLLALVLALVLWAALITQDPTLTRIKTFNDVAVTVSGSDTLKRSGYIVVSDLNELLRGVTVEASVPQRRYEEAAAAAYNLRMDLTRLNSPGVHEIKIQSSTNATYGTVTEITPASITVEVEEYVTRYRIPVFQSTTGTVPEGWYAEMPTISPNTVTVSGPKSLVDSIVRAAVTIDLSDLPAQESAERTAVPFTLMDRAGNPIESGLLSVTSEGVLLDSVIVEQKVYPTQVIDLSAANLVTGTPAAGYEIKSITYTPESVTAAGSMESLSVLDTLFVSTSADVTGATGSVTRILSIRRPTELVNLTPSTITVQVEIGPVISKRTFAGLKINVDGVDSSLKATPSLTTTSVVVTGPQLWVNTLKSGSFRLSCDAAGLEAGVHELPVTCVITAQDDPEHEVAIANGTITVTLKAR